MRHLADGSVRPAWEHAAVCEHGKGGVRCHASFNAGWYNAVVTLIFRSNLFEILWCLFSSISRYCIICSFEVHEGEYALMIPYGNNSIIACVACKAGT